MAERDKPPSLEAIDARLKAARAARESGRRGRLADGRSANASGLGIGLRIATEIVAAIGVGVGVGLVLDRWLGSGPWLMLLFLVLGCAAAMLNVMRTANQLERQRKSATPGGPKGTSDRDAR